MAVEPRQLFTPASRPPALARLYQAAGVVEEVPGEERVVVIPLTRSLHPSSRHYLDVEVETKRVSQKEERWTTSCKYKGSKVGQ